MTGLSKNARQINSAKIERGAIEVFSTNVARPAQAAFMLGQLRLRFPTYHATFDLEDCDRVLRVTSFAGPVNAGAIIDTFVVCGFDAGVLPDQILPFTGLQVAGAAELAR